MSLAEVLLLGFLVLATVGYLGYLGWCEFFGTPVGGSTEGTNDGDRWD